MLPRVEIGGSSICRRASSRSSRTSVSRTAPRSCPSHCSSARSATSQSGSTTAPNVRRSDRSRRVATRAWWTPSGSIPIRTAGSRAINRAAEVATAAGDFERRRRGRVSVAPRDRGDRGRAGRAPARSSGSAPVRPRPRPAAAPWWTRPVRPGEIGGFHLELAEAGGEARAVEHRDLVVDHLGELRAVAVAHHEAVADRVEPGGEHQRLAPDQREPYRPRLPGGSPGPAVEVQLGTYEARDRPVGRGA